jgi:hypothetical protein
LSLDCNDIIFKRLFTRSKNREETELQQGTPEVRKIYETGYIQPMKWSGLKIGPTSEEI